MKDLSGNYTITLTPTSQEGGGMVYDNSRAMTAPGSAPVTPMKTPYGADMPFDGPVQIPAPGNQIPVSDEKDRTQGNPAVPDESSGGGWTYPGSDAGGWKEA